MKRVYFSWQAVDLFGEIKVVARDAGNSIVGEHDVEVTFSGRRWQPGGNTVTDVWAHFWAQVADAFAPAVLSPTVSGTTEVNMRWGCARPVTWTGTAVTVQVASPTPAALRAAIGIPSTSFPIWQQSTGARPIMQPSGTWFPKVFLNDRGEQVERWQNYSDGPSSDGTVVVVLQQEGRPPVWRHVRLDGGPGVFGARIQDFRRQDGALAALAGVNTGDAFVALDCPGGFWEHSCRGGIFWMSDEANPTIGQEGPFVIVNPSNAASPPVDMSSWFALRDPCIVDTRSGGGRRDVQIAMLPTAEPPPPPSDS